MTAVAIDGPAGAGKSSVARAVADALGFRYVDTGAMYRAVALAALENGVDLDDEEELSRLIRRLKMELTGDVVRLDGRDVTELLRGSEVSEAAARAARHRAVREELVRLQREISSTTDVVMEGRDIGTEVLPDAEAKIFLTASLTERARRRCQQLGVHGDAAALAQIRAEIERRDDSDRSRAVSPLTQAKEAVVIDTTGLAPEDVVATIAALVRSAVEQRRG